MKSWVQSQQTDIKYVEKIIGFHCSLEFIHTILVEQVHVSGAHHSPNKQSKIPIIQGELHPILQAKSPSSEASVANAKLPTIIITAHIDNFGLINVSIPYLLTYY